MVLESPELSSPREVMRLFNETYMTVYGTKEIVHGGRRALVHETGGLPYLIDAWLHKKAGLEPPRDSRLSEPGIEATLDRFVDREPMLTSLLLDITMKRDEEERNRAAVRRQIEEDPFAVFRREMSDLKVGPSEQEQAYRDFIYSQTLDHIGDMTWRDGFDLNRLVL